MDTELYREFTILLAKEGGFDLRRVLVKSQRTRWASCSKNKTISLNLKLLFIPADLIRYALIHELCHTERMNHSKEFWAIVRDHEPDFRALDDKLRSAWRYVPAWLDADKMRGENGRDSECQ